MPGCSKDELLQFLPGGISLLNLVVEQKTRRNKYIEGLEYFGTFLTLNINTNG